MSPVRDMFLAPLRESRPLAWAMWSSVAVTIVAAVGMIVDPRELAGEPIWTKSFKFGLSIAIYTWTLAWMLSLLRPFRRTAGVLCGIIAAALIVENALIGIQIVRGVRSHFNNTTALDSTIYTIMGIGIVTVWLANLVLGFVLMAQKPQDAVLFSGIRLGTLVGLVGMILAVLMTVEELGVITNYSEGFDGAHTVGAADGGPGLPILGWSTVNGDLRVPHFIGLHALQILPIVAILVRALTTRLPWLDDTSARSLVRLAAAGYAGIMLITAWQAWRGQSVVAPDALTVTAGVTLVVLVAAGVALVFALARQRARVRIPTPRLARPRRGSARHDGKRTWPR